MKLAKLSLAAIVAAGAMTTFANAASLEEAIKGVEVNGMMRYRFTNNDSVHSDDHEFKIVTELIVPVADNLKAGTAFVALNKDDAKNGSASFNGDNITLNMDMLWFQYGVEAFSLKAGKFEVATPWTDGGIDGTIGNGALAMFKGVPGWTFAAAAFVDTNLELLDNIGQENLYAVGALGSVGPVGLQLWGASMTNVVDYSVFGQVDFSMAGFSIGAQANQLKLADEVAGDGEDSGIYWGVKAGYEMAGFGITLGFTQNDEDMPYYALAADDAAGFYFSDGKQINGKYANYADANVFYADLTYDMGPWGFGAGYAMAGSGFDVTLSTKGENNKVETNDGIGSEWYVSGSYKYSKNFKLSSYYSSLEMEEGVGTDNDRIRFEAKYSF